MWAGRQCESLGAAEPRAAGAVSGAEPGESKHTNAICGLKGIVYG